MFYPVDALRRGGKFYMCWVADSCPPRFTKITHRQLWSQDIRETCDELIQVLKNESGIPKYRFSLRLSSQLMRGLVRLYQRKVTVLFADLCMIYALVMKISNKKYNREQHERVAESDIGLPRIFIEEAGEEEITEAEIRANGNIVANIEDITLKEPILPENRLLLDDGFGELNPELLQSAADRTVEMMLVQETSMKQHSALELPVDVSDKSHDKSRLAPHDVLMERVSEYDTTMFRQSVGGELIPDFEKEIPEIPEIPPPIPALELDNVNKERELQDAVTEPIKEPEQESLVLEELQEPQVKRRKMNKLIIDKKTQLSSNFLRSRIDNIDLELRCKDYKSDVISLLVPPHRLLQRAAHCGHRARDYLSYHLANIFISKLDPAQRRPFEDIMARTVEAYPSTTKILETIEEVPEVTVIQEHGQEPSNVVQETMVLEPVDISDLPTQRIPIVSEKQSRKRPSQTEITPKRLRRSGYTPFVMYRDQIEQDLENLDSNKENVPQEQPESLLSGIMAGIDVTWKKQFAIDPATIQPVAQRKSEESSETPLGSLDRTKVSLGDSEKTTESKKFIEEEWGAEGTMLKIYKCIKRSTGDPIDVDYLLSQGPVMSGHKRVTAARCFSSILKLKSNGLIKVLKDPVTLEIRDIKLGDIITSRQRNMR